MSQSGTLRICGSSCASAAGAGSVLAPTSIMEHLVVLLVLCLSGNPSFMGPVGDIMLIASAGLLTILLVANGRFHVTARLLLVFGGFMAILMLQAIDFSYLPIVTIAGFMIRLYVAYACMTLVPNFPKVYVNVMYGVGLLSLLFYIPQNAFALAGVNMSSFFGPFARGVGDEHHMHVVLYTFIQGTFPLRNAGFFWEPGAFAGFLLLALIFLCLARSEFTRRQYRRRLGLLILCLLTTKSTMGYGVLPVALVLHFWSGFHATGQVTRRMLLIVGTAIVLATIAWSFVQLEFMQNKIRSQLTVVEKKGSGWQITRFGSFLFDLDYIKRRPVLGWGLHSKTRFALNPETDIGWKHGNGLSDFVAKFGFVGLGILMTAVGVGVYRLTGRSAFPTILILVMILLVSNGEAFLRAPVFLGAMFLAMRGLAPGARRHITFAAGRGASAR